MAQADKVTDLQERKQFDDETKQKLQDAHQQIKELKAKRKGVNEEVSAVMNKLEGQGFSKKGLKAAMMFLDLDETDGILFDNTFIAFRTANGRPVQPDLFEATLNTKFLRDQQPEED